MTITFGSLFTGIGGFDLGFEKAGMICKWQCEIDKDANRVLELHWPGLDRYTDVMEIEKNKLRPVDLVCGGFPCQDLSIAGKRKGLAGERSGLWFEFARIIKELIPQWVIIENVPGLLSSHKGNDFKIILSQLVKFGYCVSWRILDAQFFGVAQRRRRLFIVGSFGNGCSAEILFEREGMCWDPPEGKKTGKDIAGTLDKKSCSSNRGSQVNEIDFIAGIYRESVDKGDGEIKLVPNGDSHSGFRDEGGLVIMSHGQTNAEILEDKSLTLNTNHEQPICWEMQHANEACRENGDISSNLQAHMGTGGNNISLIGVRRLTPTECERLQGFPDNWTKCCSDMQRYKQLGNAVAVPVAEWIGKRIVTHGIC